MRRYTVGKKSKKIKQNQRSGFCQMQLVANAEGYTRPSALGSRSREGRKQTPFKSRSLQILAVSANSTIISLVLVL